jgi:hypothetical protein
MTCFGCPAYILGYTPTDRGVKTEWECKLNLSAEDCPKLLEQEETDA